VHDASDEPEQDSLLSRLEDDWAAGGKAGVDEVGIGPLAGPVVASAVLLDPECPVDGLTDSKALTAKQREELADEIKARSLAWAVASASVAEIDELNILRASHLAMQRAVAELDRVPAMVLVDGNKTPALAVPAVAIVQGDRLVPQIGAASILAKVARDAMMLDLADRFPGYGFEKHKGYPTKQHVQALKALGASEVHRRSFAPVRDVLAAHAVEVGEPLQPELQIS
jgi:ribonuclease HII